MTDEQKPKTGKRDDPRNPELNRETLQDLSPEQAEAAQGGGFLDDAIGFAKKATPPVAQT